MSELDGGAPGAPDELELVAEAARAHAAIREQIGSAVDVIIQLQRHRDGRRLVTQITECVGVSSSTGALEMRDLFTRPPDASRLQATGQLPTFIEALLDGGDIDLESFY